VKPGWGEAGIVSGDHGMGKQKTFGVSLQTLSGLGANMIGCIAR
jgi:hypothetical protein